MTSKLTDAVERDDGMDDDNYHTREVYANFGLAVYHAQVLEHGVVNLLTFAAHPGPCRYSQSLRHNHGP